MNRLNYRYFAPLAVILATLFLLGGCIQNKEEAEARRQERLRQEVFDIQSQMMTSGEIDPAIAKLEALDKKHPRSLDVVEALANAYGEKQDYLMAAFLYEYAFELEPQKPQNILLAADAHEKGGSGAEAAEGYRTFIRAEPAAASVPGIWRRIAQLEMAQESYQSALSAYLEVLRIDREQFSAQDRLNVATLYHRLGNYPQAVRWYEELLAQQGLEDEIRAQAKIGQFDLALRQKDWERSVTLMQEIDALSPGTLQAGPYAAAYAELSAWDQRRKAEAAAREKVAAEKAAQEKAEQEKAAAEKLAAEQAAQQALAQSGTTASAGEQTATAGASATGAETLAQTGADGESSVAGSTVASAAKAPDGQPDQTATAAVRASAVDSGTVAATTSAATGDTAAGSTAASATDATQAAAAEASDASAAELAQRGRAAFEQEDYATATELLERSAKINPNNGEVLDMLSRSSYRIGLYPQAERYAKLATYAEPENVNYRLEYLRAYQRNNPPPAMLDQLISAKEEFPADPNVTLALARGYEHIAGRKALAAGLYHEYLRMVPASPFAADIRQKLLEWEM